MVPHAASRRSATLAPKVPRPKDPRGLTELGYHRRFNKKAYLAAVLPALESSATLAEAAEKLGISWRTLQRWMSDPKAPEEIKKIKAERFPHGGNRLG